MRKSDITKLLQNKLGCEKSEIKNAISELGGVESIVNFNEFLKVCLSENRYTELTSLLSKHLENYDKVALVDLICDWLLSPDICFNVWNIFNRYDICARGIKSLSTFSFLMNPGHIPLSMDSIEKVIREGHLFNTYGLCEHFLNEYLDKKHGENLEYILIEVVRRVGFLAFRISPFLDIASRYSYNPAFNRKLKRLIKNIHAEPTDKQREYISYYALIEKLKPKIGTMKAFDRVADYFGMEPETIKTRYYELVRKFRKEKVSLTVDEIIRRYRLERIENEFFENK